MRTATGWSSRRCSASNCEGSGFSLTATLLALLSASYYVVYAVLLIPVGMLLDAYGPRHLLVAGGSLMGVGTLAMAHAASLPDLFVSRVVLGAGASVTFLGAMKVAAIWLPPTQFATASALTGALGTVGAMIATRPLAAAASSPSGWRGAFVALGLATLGLALTAWPLLAKPAAPAAMGASAPRRDVDALRRVARQARRVFENSGTWWLCLSYVCVYSWWGALSLWIAPYLRDVHGLSAAETGTYTVLPFLAFLLAAPCTARLSDRLRRRRGVYVAMLLGVLGSWTGFVWSLGQLDLWVLRVLLVLFGVFGSAFVLAWATAHEINPPEVAGVAVAVVTLVGFLGVAFTQGIVGVILDVLSTGGTQRSAVAYQAAFGLYAFLVLAGVVSATLVPETYGQNISGRRDHDDGN